tara:strand:+ start:1545 stop:3176 length:1632 start_codon:yes stop_codon:yes gene_type:complete
MSSFSILSFILTTASVMILTYIIVSKMKKSDSPVEEYFTAGRSLSWPIIGGSLLLTNISTEQLVGLNGDVFGDKALVGIAWEALAAFAMIATALIFLPRYLASGFTTTPAFLEKRFDKATRSLVSGLFLFGYVTVLLPVVLYTGSLVLKGMFSLQIPLFFIVLVIGVLGGGYAILGGLKTVAVSDTINGIGLFIGGLAVPILALIELGDGSFFIGIEKLLMDQPKYLSVLTQTNVDQKIVSVPWPTLLTGMMFIQVFYWSTNQVIVQRAMAAKSLSEGQKGVLFASFMKLLGPLMLCLPGIIALHLVNIIDINTQDQVYGAMVRHVLPSWSVGLFAAVLLGSILSSFNSALNSASTLFSLQFYKGYIKKSASSEEIVTSGKYFGIVLSIVSILIAPQLEKMESIFTYLQKINGLYSVPIIGIFILGIATKKVSAFAAKFGMVAGIVVYAYFSFINIKDVPVFFADSSGNLHWLHGYFISFVFSVSLMLFISYIFPKTKKEIALSEKQEIAPIDMKPWEYARVVSFGIILITIGIYSFFTIISN